MAKPRSEPFHEVLDAWVLRAIGHLDKATEANLVANEPDMRANFKQDGAWHEIVAKAMGFEDALASKILGVWANGADKFEKAGAGDPDPVEFAQTFVDVKFLGAQVDPTINSISIRKQ